MRMELRYELFLLKNNYVFFKVVRNDATDH